jgi:putative DNA primase/helicase
VASLQSDKSNLSVGELKMPKKLAKYKTGGLSGEFGGLERLENEPPVNWLIPGWLAAREVTCIYGKGATMKSYIALGWSMQLAVAGKSVLYIAAEGTSGLRSRVDAWRAKHNKMSLDIPTWNYYNANIYVDVDDQLSMWMTALYNYLGKSDKLDLIIIDTLARNFLGDENSAKEMGMFVQGCEDIRRGFDTAVLVVHHEGVTTGRDRGSPALRNATFAMFKTGEQRSRDSGASVAITCDRMKDAKAPDEARIEFDLIDLDVDEHGEVFQSSLAMRTFPPKKLIKRRQHG